MSDEELRLRVCEWLGIDPAARVGTTGGWRQVPPLSDRGYWLPLLIEAWILRRGDVVFHGAPEQPYVTVYGPVGSGVECSWDGTDAAALARAMLAAVEAEGSA